MIVQADFKRHIPFLENLLIDTKIYRTFGFEKN